MALNKNSGTLKVAITGAHGVGKTTLANQIKEHFDNVNVSSIVLEIPRYICTLSKDKEYLRRGHNNPLKQTLLLLGQVTKESYLSLAKNIDILICDRCILDHWAYTLYLFKNAFTNEDINLMFEHFVLKHYDSYDLVFYYPIERDPIDDGVREADIEFQREIDSFIFKLLREYKLNHIQISSKEKKYFHDIIANIEDKYKLKCLT